MVIAILGILMALFLPAVHSALAMRSATVCTSNLRQLHAANVLYASEYGRYVAAAPDIHGANLRRWHGVRASETEPFDPKRGPLAPYLGGDGAVRCCPGFRDAAEGFEGGCGGYGYNQYGVGSQSYLHGSLAGAAEGMSPGGIRSPAQTVMFADAAFPQNDKGRTVLIEYSFAEPYRHVADRAPTLTYTADPSIHFRHNGRAHVVWCDGHVSRETRAFTKKAGGFEANDIGWFGSTNNALFDPF